MAIAQGSQTQVTVLEESTYGTPAFALPGDTQIVPIISNNLNLSKAIFENPSIVSDRQPLQARHGNREISGDISFAYAHEEYDMFLEGVFFDAFSTNVLDVGTTLKSYTVEVGHLDIGQYREFTGVVATSMALEVNIDGVVQTTFSLMGKDMTLGAVAQDSAPTAATGKLPFVHFSGTFKEGGSVVANITSISLTVDNGIASNYALGSDAVYAMTAPNMTVSGTVTAYFEDAVLLNKFINDTETSLEFTLDDGSGNSHTYLMANVHYNSAGIDISDGGVLPITMEFNAYKDSVSGKTITLTRTA